MVLQEHHIALKSADGWIETGANLSFLADLLGATDEAELQRSIYAQQRFVWLCWLNSRMGVYSAFDYSGEDYPFEQFEPPWESDPPPI